MCKLALFGHTRPAPGGHVPPWDVVVVRSAIGRQLLLLLLRLLGREQGRMLQHCRPEGRLLLLRGLRLQLRRLHAAVLRLVGVLHDLRPKCVRANGELI